MMDTLRGVAAVAMAIQFAIVGCSQSTTAPSGTQSHVASQKGDQSKIETGNTASDGTFNFATASDSQIIGTLGSLKDMLQIATDMLRQEEVLLVAKDKSGKATQWLASAITNGDRLTASLREKLEMGTFPTKSDRDAISKLNLECIDYSKTVTDKLIPLKMGVPMDEQGRIDIDFFREELTNFSDATKGKVEIVEGLLVTLERQVGRNAELRANLEIIRDTNSKLKKDLSLLNELIEGPLDPLASINAVVLLHQMNLTARESQRESQKFHDRLRLGR